MQMSYTSIVKKINKHVTRSLFIMIDTYTTWPRRIIIASTYV